MLIFGITLQDTYSFEAGRCELLEAFMFLPDFWAYLWLGTEGDTNLREEYFVEVVFSINIDYPKSL